MENILRSLSYRAFSAHFFKKGGLSIYEKWRPFLCLRRFSLPRSNHWTAIGPSLQLNGRRNIEPRATQEPLIGTVCLPICEVYDPSDMKRICFSGDANPDLLRESQTPYSPGHALYTGHASALGPYLPHKQELQKFSWFMAALPLSWHSSTIFCRFFVY